MRLTPILVGAVLTSSGCGADEAAPSAAPTRATAEAESTIESLRREIVPPIGTVKADVDAVYGTPRVSETLRSKGNPAYYPMHEYTLLQPRPGAEFRAFLYVTYRNDRVYRAGINHSCVSKNLRIGPSPDVALATEEERGVLEDLLLIEGTFRTKLLSASWNL